MNDDLILENVIDNSEVPDDLKKELCNTWGPFRKVLDQLVIHYVKGKWAKLILETTIKIIDSFAKDWCKE